MKRITSRQNAVVAAFREAARGTSAGTLLLDGPHLVHEALVAGLAFERVLVASDATGHPEISDLLRRLAGTGVEASEATAAVMDAASPLKSGSSLLALARRPATQAVFHHPAPLVLVACDIQDPGNLGAMVRAAEAAGATGVVAAGHGADPFGWKALRGSMGSALRLPIQHGVGVEQAVADARHAGVRLVATVAHGGQPMTDAALGGPLAILIGGEGAGLPDTTLRAADLRVSIPMQPPVESLNAAVAAAVLLYEVRRQRAAGHADAVSSPVGHGAATR